MSWTIILENENRENILSLGQEFFSKIILSEGNIQDFILLKYLDPYGDTLFNKLQMKDLINEFHALNIIEPNPLIDEIIKLAEKCKSESHHYLAFYGD